MADEERPGTDAADAEKIAGAEAALPQAVLTITLLPNGGINVSYPMNEMVTRFMLDKARAFLDDEFRRMNTLTITAPNGHLPPRLRSLGKPR